MPTYILVLLCLVSSANFFGAKGTSSKVHRHYPERNNRKYEKQISHCMLNEGLGFSLYVDLQKTD